MGKKSQHLTIGILASGCIWPGCCASNLKMPEEVLGPGSAAPHCLLRELVEQVSRQNRRETLRRKRSKPRPAAAITSSNEELGSGTAALHSSNPPVPESDFI